MISAPPWKAGRPTLPRSATGIRARSSGLQELAKAEYGRDDRESHVRFIEIDTEFHVGIAQLTRNPLLVRAVADMRCQMERIMFASLDIGYHGELPSSEHRGIVEAIQKARCAARSQADVRPHLYFKRQSSPSRYPRFAPITPAVAARLSLPRTRQYATETSSRNGRNAGTVYCSPST